MKGPISRTETVSYRDLLLIRVRGVRDRDRKEKEPPRFTIQTFSLPLTVGYHYKGRDNDHKKDKVSILSTVRIN